MRYGKRDKESGFTPTHFRSAENGDFGLDFASAIMRPIERFKSRPSFA